MPYALPAALDRSPYGKNRQKCSGPTFVDGQVGALTIAVFIGEKTRKVYEANTGIIT